jgi:hypothetical protein
MPLIEQSRLAAAIAAACDDATLLAELDTVLERVGRSEALAWSWSQGGCLIIAEAIRRVAGGVLVGAFEEGIDGEADESTLDHVLVELSEGAYADARGVRDLDAALDDVIEIGGFESPILVPLDGAHDPRLAANVIAYDERLATRLTSRMRDALA